MKLVAGDLKKRGLIEPQLEDAVERIQTFVGTRYDPDVVAAFAQACDEGQIRPGSVKLKRPTKPQANIPPEAIQPSTERETVSVS